MIEALMKNYTSIILLTLLLSGIYTKINGQMSADKDVVDLKLNSTIEIPKKSKLSISNNMVCVLGGVSLLTAGIISTVTNQTGNDYTGPGEYISPDRMAIVIGSGFGGMAAALRMRSKGYEVTLLEKHPDLGGRARVFKKGDFIYDAGPTVITAPYLFEELFSLFNKDIANYVKIVPLDLWYRFVFEDGSTFDYSGIANKMES